MSDWQLRSVNIEISIHGRDFEPNECEKETSVVLPKLMGALFQEGMTRGQIAKELQWPVSELEELLFGMTLTGVPGGGGGTKNGTSAKLKRIK